LAAGAPRSRLESEALAEEAAMTQRNQDRAADANREMAPQDPAEVDRSAVVEDSTSEQTAHAQDTSQAEGDDFEY
jgi:hypothetical protein